MDENVPETLLPTPFTTAMIATAMPAAIRPYSMAVAPPSSLRNRSVIVRIRILLCVCLHLDRPREDNAGPGPIVCDGSGRSPSRSTARFQNPLIFIDLASGLLS